MATIASEIDVVDRFFAKCVVISLRNNASIGNMKSYEKPVILIPISSKSVNNFILNQDLQLDPFDEDEFSTLEDEAGKEYLRLEAEEKKQRRTENRQQAASSDLGTSTDPVKGSRKSESKSMSGTSDSTC